MPKKNRDSRREVGRPSSAGQSPAPRSAIAVPTPFAHPALFAVGLVGLVGAAVASLLLVVEAVAGLSLPGCGPGGACQRAAESFWGKVQLGGFVWPVSFLGLSYFSAALVGWLMTRGALPGVLRWIARVGVLVSVLYGVVIVRDGLFCPYCLASHAGNLVFWIAAELTKARSRAVVGPLVAGLVVFAATSVGAGVARSSQKAAVEKKGEAERTQAVQEMIRKGQEATATTQPADSATPAPATQPAPSPATQPSPVATIPPSPIGEGETLAGRYVYGPPAAPIRIVMFTGYQCPDCLRLEGQLLRLMAERTDMQVSIRHFPFNSECNPFVPRTSQPNGCWAARAAEAAGMLYGTDGFWKMHKWLFEPQRRGSFTTTQELQDAIRSFGYDPTAFEATMRSEETLRRVREDCQLANELGLFFTPMIFVNGVELKGWHVPDALLKTVSEVAAANPPALPPTADRPVGSMQKHIDDWREQTVQNLAADSPMHRLGAEGAKVQIVLWGDLQEPTTLEADAEIRRLVASRGDVSYVYRHFPFDQSCNSGLERTMFPNGCRAARLAEAAGAIGGEAGYWAMHAWLAENRADISDTALRGKPLPAGLTADALLAKVDDPAIAAAISNDIAGGQALPSLRIGMPRGISSIPTIFINGKLVPRWKTANQSMLGPIIAEAAK